MLAGVRPRCARVALVDVHQRPGGFQPDHERLRRGEPVPLVQDRGQAAAGEVLRHGVGLRLEAPVVHRQHSGVAERRGRPHLIGEALREAGALGGVGPQDLERHPSAQREVIGHVDAGVRSLSDELQQPVAGRRRPASRPWLAITVVTVPPNTASTGPLLLVAAPRVRGRYRAGCDDYQRTRGPSGP